MPGKKSAEEKVIDYFEAAPLEKAQVMLVLAKRKVKQREGEILAVPYSAQGLVTKPSRKKRKVKVPSVGEKPNHSVKEEEGVLV